MTMYNKYNFTTYNSTLCIFTTVIMHSMMLLTELKHRTIGGIFLNYLFIIVLNIT